MKENQQIEWKESWRDEYLRWICGFANAEGGVLHIGRNDRGVVVGVPDAARLMEDLPNKVRDILGIMVGVNLREEAGKEYLEIVVEPYPYPVSYKACRMAHAPVPSLRYEPSGLWVEFSFPRGWHAAVGDSSEKGSGKTPIETPGKRLGKRLGKTPNHILALLQGDPQLTVSEMAKHLSKSESAVNRAIQKLQAASRLRRAGSRKAGYWEVLP